MPKWRGADGFDGQCRLPVQARGDAEFGWIDLGPRKRISTLPTEPAQLLDNDSFRLGFRSFPEQLARVMVAEFIYSYREAVG